MKNSKPFVITISRLLGSGGAYIGQELAKKLNVLYLDRQIISKAAKEFNVSEKEIEDLDERLTSFWESLFQGSMFTNATGYIAPEYYGPIDNLLYEFEAELIEQTARKESAVITGRCGSYILSDHPRHISVFLHGDVEFRKKRVQKIYDVDEKTAAKMITDSDKKRRAFYRTFTGKEFTDSREYTLCLDTSKIGIEESIEIIYGYAEKKFGLVKVAK